MIDSVTKPESDRRLALEGRDISVQFGGIKALSNVSVAVARGEIAGLVGPNGAGKSTLLAALSGLQRLGSGRILLGGEDVTGATPQRRARRGLARTFQHPELFATLTVREHVVLGYRVRNSRSRFVTDLFIGRGLRRSRDVAEDARVDEILQLLSLEEIGHRQALELPLGASRLVEIGRALATSPSVLLLDEPSSGLDRRETARLGEVLAQVVEEHDVALVMVEHDVDLVLGLADTVFVLDFGICIAHGTPAEIRQSPEVRAAYLGDDIVREHRGIAEAGGEAA